jgi:hypothetical protein
MPLYVVKDEKNSVVPSDSPRSNPERLGIVEEIKEFIEVLNGVGMEKTTPRWRFRCSHRKYPSVVKVEPKSDLY